MTKLNTCLIAITLIAVQFHLLLGANETQLGALISVEFTGIVGFNLDEIPTYSFNASLDFVMHNLTDSDWLQRARRQIFATTNRQVFGFEQQLTLPPEDVWKVTLTSPPFLELIQNHAYVVRTYRFYSVLVGSASSVNKSQPLLTKLWATYQQEFIVPVDPEHLFQRTGFACTNPSGAIYSENILSVFDETITNGNSSCVQVLEQKVGSTKLKFFWQRLAWNEEIAEKFRYGSQESLTADLEGVLSDLRDEINIGYKFIDENSCTLKEGGAGLNKGCVGGTGWRQLLKFTSASVNVGRTEIHLGDVLSNTYIDKGVFEFDPCHGHYHFQHYANFAFGNLL